MAYIYGNISKCTVGSGSTNSAYECRLGYQVNSQSIPNNTSSITLRLEVRSINSSYKSYGYNQTSTIDGTALSSKSFDMRSTNTWQLFGERTITVSHNASGGYSATKSASFTTTASGSYSLKSGSASVTVAPTTIPRASEPTLSASSIQLGASVTINTNRKSSSFTHTLRYKFGSQGGVIASNVGASATFTPHVNLSSQIPNATRGTCTITCETYNGSTLVGSKTINLTLTVPTSVIPTISSIALSEANSYVPTAWGYVQNKTRLKVVTTASGAYGSTIKSYKITGIDNGTYNSSNFTSNTLTQPGTKTIKVVVTDTRDRSATKEITYTCTAYANPSISVASVTRCNSDGTANEEGTSVKYTFKSNISAVNNKNSHVFKIGYKKSTDSSYTYVTIANNGYALEKNNVVLSGVTFSVDNSYDFQFVASDYFMTASNVQHVATGFTLIDYNSSGKAMAFGKVSEASSNEKLLEVALPVDFQDGVRINGVEQFKDKTYWMDTVKWCRVAEASLGEVKEGSSCIAKISTDWGITEPMSILVNVLTMHRQAKITEMSKLIYGSTKTISKLRIQYDDTKKKMFLDVLYNVNANNWMRINIISKDEFWNLTENWNVTEYTTVADLIV